LLDFAQVVEVIKSNLTDYPRQKMQIGTVRVQILRRDAARGMARHEKSTVVRYETSHASWWHPKVRGCRTRVPGDHIRERGVGPTRCRQTVWHTCNRLNWNWF